MQREPAFNLPPVVVWLGVTLAGVHAARLLLDEPEEVWVLLAFAFIPARYSELAAALPGGWAACVWSPVTYAFLHADAVHLIINLVWMASFGGALGRRFGAARFLALSLLAAVAGAALHFAVHPADESVVIGASGAVSGMMAATARFAFSLGGPLAGGARTVAAYRAPAEPLGAALRNTRALGFIAVWFAVNLLFGLAGSLLPGVSGPIAWQAHIGGFLAGLLCFSLLDPAPREKRPADELAS